MKVNDILKKDINESVDVLVDENGDIFEAVYVDEDDNILDEGVVRQWKKVNNRLIRKYRCMSGKKKGKLVSDPSKCGQRKDPKKVRTGRKIMRSKKGIIGRKSKIAKRKSISTRLRKMNARLMGKQV